MWLVSTAANLRLALPLPTCGASFGTGTETRKPNWLLRTAQYPGAVRFAHTAENRLAASFELNLATATIPVQEWIEALKLTPRAQPSQGAKWQRADKTMRAAFVVFIGVAPLSVCPWRDCRGGVVLMGLLYHNLLTFNSFYYFILNFLLSKNLIY